MSSLTEIIECSSSKGSRRPVTGCHSLGKGKKTMKFWGKYGKILLLYGEHHKSWEKYIQQIWKNMETDIAKRYPSIFAML